MGKVSKKGGKTLYITLSVYRCGNADPTKNLTISCPDNDTLFRTTLSDNSLQRFLDFVKVWVINFLISGELCRGSAAKLLAKAQPFEILLKAAALADERLFI